MTTDLVDVSRILDDQRLGRYNLFVIALCFLVMVVDGYDFFVVGYILPAIAKSFGVAPAAVTPVIFTQQFGFIAGTYLVAPFADRYGRRWLLLLSTLLFGLVTVATTFAGSLAAMSVLRILAGVFLASVMPNAIALTTEYAPKRLRAVMVGVIFCGFSVGAGPGGAIAGALTTNYGWQGAFWLGGLAPLALTPFLYFVLPESIRFLAGRGDRGADTARLLRRLDPSLQVTENSRFVAGEEQARGIPVAGLFRERRGALTILLWLTFFANVMLVNLFGAWLPTMIHDFAGVALPVAASLAGTIGLGGMVGYLVLGYVIDRFNPARILALNCAVGAAATFAVGLLMHDLLLLTIDVFIIGFTIIGGQGGLNALGAIVYPTGMRVTGVGWAIGIGRFGGLAGAALGGFMLAQHWTAEPIFVVAALPAMAACIAIFFVRPGTTDKNVPRAQAQDA